MITKNTESFAALDAGNSRVKLRLGKNKAFSFSYDKLDDLFRLIENKRNSKLSIYYSSVNPEKLEIIRERYKSDKLISFYSAVKILQTKEYLDYKSIKGIGEDRLLGLCGAAFKYQPPLATIDCGTAITVNFLDAERKVLGGTIFPGLQTQANALNFFTSRLPGLDYKKSRKIIGKNTSDAILAGITNSAFGGIKETIIRAEKRYFDNKEINLIFTGGSGKDMYLIMKKERKNVFYDEYLVLNGILNLIS